MKKKILKLKAYLEIKRQDLFAQRSNSKSVREAWQELRRHLI